MENDKLLQYYQSIREESDLTDFIKNKVREDLHLEFKMKKDSRTGVPDKSDKFQFSRALSGFANSEGGTLIWGIETDKNEQAKKLKPIKEINNFCNALKKSLINATQPVVDNVLLEIIPKGISKSMGFIKCYIPQSDKTPHRAMQVNKQESREYYKRSIEGFYKLEHFDLEDMFGRRQRPYLAFTFEIMKMDNGEETLDCIFMNEGKSVAKYYGFICSFENLEIKKTKTIRDISNLNNGNPTVSYENNTGVIHPNGVRHLLGSITFERKNKSKKVKASINFCCENMLPRTLNMEV